MFLLKKQTFGAKKWCSTQIFSKYVLNSLIWKNEKGKKFGENARKCLQNLLTEINAIFSEYIRDLMY